MLDMDKMLEVNNISKSFGSLKAIDNVSIAIEKGGIFGLVGESGCGKSTLARIIMRLIDPDSGSVNFNGQNISEIRGERLREIRKKIQIVFQDPAASLNPRMTVGEAVAEPLVIHRPEDGGQRAEAGEQKPEAKGQRPEARGKRAKEEAVRLLYEVGLNDKYMNRYPHEISGGECQRVCIARAMALGPSFVVLDEPVSSLDHSVQGKIIDLLLSIKRAKGLTYLFITHDLVLAQKICDKVAVMKDGRIIESGTAGEIFSAPREEYTRQLIRDSI